jgi:hypothetical protein
MSAGMQGLLSLGDHSLEDRNHPLLFTKDSALDGIMVRKLPIPKVFGFNARRFENLKRMGQLMLEGLPWSRAAWKSDVHPRIAKLFIERAGPDFREAAIHAQQARITQRHAERSEKRAQIEERKRLRREDNLRRGYRCYAATETKPWACPA